MARIFMPPACNPWSMQKKALLHYQKTRIPERLSWPISQTALSCLKKAFLSKARLPAEQALQQFPAILVAGVCGYLL
jgi:hypothetical protein